MKWFPHRAAVALAMFSVVGCGEPSDGPTENAEGTSPVPVVPSPDAERVSMALRRLGYRVPGVEVHIDDAQDLVRVSGDMLFVKSALLAGSYDRAASEGDDPIAKGYRSPDGLVSSANASKIKLVFKNLTAAMENAAIHAAIEWSHQGSRINISLGDPGTSDAFIRIIGLDEAAFEKRCGDTVLACTMPPLDGHPGDVWIRVNARLGARKQCAWTDSALRATMVHELGHAIGLVHPEDPKRRYIPGTLQGKDYPTIMHDGLTLSAAFDPEFCEAAVDYPQADDRKSIQVLYPR